MNCEAEQPTSFGVLKENLIKSAWCLRFYEGMGELLLLTGERAGMFFTDEDRAKAGLPAKPKAPVLIADVNPRSSGMPVASEEE